MDGMSASSPSAPGKRKRRHVKIRAHANPLSDGHFDYPISPSSFPLEQHYLPYSENKDNPHPPPEIADIGCGFGELTVNLSPLFPEKRVLALEIRDRVVAAVERKIRKLRADNASKPTTAGCPMYGNIAVVKTNVMKFLVNFFAKGQLSKMFFCFPDPHFKKSNHRRRIISPALLSEYAYVMRVGGLAYTITDVLDLHQWMDSHFAAHPLFEKVPQDEWESDPVIELMREGTDEARKVTRLGGSKWITVYRRVQPEHDAQQSAAFPPQWSTSTQAASE